MVNRSPNSSEIKRSQENSSPKRLLRDIMSKNLRTTSEDTPVGTVRKQMRDHGIRHVLVVDTGSGVLKGVLSDRDVRAILSPFVGTPQATERDEATLAVKVGGIMKQPPFVAHGDESIRKAVELVLQKKVGCIPVVDDGGKPVGIITTDDLLRVMLSMLSE